MARVKGGFVTRRRHSELRGATKGYRGTRSRLVKVGKDAVLHAGAYAFAGRKNRKRDFRRLWITRISGALEQYGISYSVFMNLLKKSRIELDRKILAGIIVDDSQTFAKIVEKVRTE